MTALDDNAGWPRLLTSEVIASPLMCIAIALLSALDQGPVALAAVRNELWMLQPLALPESSDVPTFVNCTEGVTCAEVRLLISTTA